MNDNATRSVSRHYVSGVGAKIVRFAAAIQAVWIYSLSGTTVGVFLVVFAQMSTSVSRYPVAQSVLGHIGVAFIVAGIGVLFYEWSTHIRAAVALTEDLQAIKSAVG